MKGKENFWEAGTTTFLGGILLKIDEEENEKLIFLIYTEFYFILDLLQVMNLFVLVLVIVKHLY